MIHTMPRFARVLLPMSLGVLLAGVFTVVAVAGQNGAKQVIPDPDQNRSTSERATAYISGFNDFMARRARWIQDFQATGKDAAHLPHAALAASYGPSLPSLTDAVKHADLVVEGVVANVVYAPSGTVGTVKIDAMYTLSPIAVARLGTARPTEVRVMLGYSPEPDETFSLAAGHLSYAENMPLLFPGARAVLFLKADQAGSTPTFSIQSFTGGYAINASGKIVPVPGNPFADQVAGLTAEQFATMVVQESRGA